MRNVCACSSFAVFLCAFIVRVPSAPKHDLTEVGSTSSGSWHLWVKVFNTVPSAASCWTKCIHKGMNDILKIQLYYTEVCVCLPFQHELQSDCLRWWLSHPQVRSLGHPLWIGMCLPESWRSQLSLFCLKENIKTYMISEITHAFLNTWLWFANRTVQGSKISLYSLSSMAGRYFHVSRITLQTAHCILIIDWV